MPNGQNVIFDFVKSEKNVADSVTMGLYRSGPRYIEGYRVKPKEELTDSVNPTF